MVKGNIPYISKGNRRGVLLLLLIIILIVFTPRVLMSLKSKDVLTVSYEELKQVDELRHQNRSRLSNPYQKRLKVYLRPPAKFNPNDYSSEQWIALGLSSKQANVVLKFTSRGVYSMDDFSKIFVIPNELMVLLKDSLVFTERKYKSDYPSKTEAFIKEKKVIHLNTASLDDIMELPGVGAYIAERIMNYRERLGGFITKEQLMDIRKIDLELFNKLEDQIIIEKQKVKQININTATADQIKSHPYFNWSLANSIVKMRTQKGGSFKSLEEILDSALIDREFFEKVKPYLSL